MPRRKREDSEIAEDAPVPVAEDVSETDVSEDTTEGDSETAEGEASDESGADTPGASSDATTCDTCTCDNATDGENEAVDALCARCEGPCLGALIGRPCADIFAHEWHADRVVIVTVDGHKYRIEA